MSGRTNALLPCLTLIVLTAVSTYGQSEFIYTNNNVRVSNTISAFSVASNGTLSQVSGSPFLTGGRSSGETVAGSNLLAIVGDFLYASNTGSDTISAFQINSTTGNLTAIPGSPFPTGAFGFNGIALSSTPDRRFLIAANRNSMNIAVFQIALGGALAPVSGSPFPVGDIMDGIQVSPDGRFLAVATPLIGMTMFTIMSTGVLVPVPGSPFQVGGVAASSAAASAQFSCTRSLLFVGEWAFPTVTIDVFNVNSNGTLASIPGSPFTQPLGIPGQSGQVALLSPDERFLFVSNQVSDTVTVFDVASDGSLTIPGSSYPTGSDTPTIMATNGAGTLLFVGNENWPFKSNISVFSIANNGLLTAIQGSPFTTGQFSEVLGPISLAVYPQRTCSQVGPFDLCIQDDSNSNILKINSTTGDYQFTNCVGIVLSGIGGLVKKGEIVTLQHNAADRRILARIDRSAKRGTASIQTFPLGMVLTITDRNTSDDTCICVPR